jgi:hypothetical protein
MNGVNLFERRTAASQSMNWTGLAPNPQKPTAGLDTIRHFHIESSVRVMVVSSAGFPIPTSLTSCHPDTCRYSGGPVACNGRQHH